MNIKVIHRATCGVNTSPGAYAGPSPKRTVKTSSRRWNEPAVTAGATVKHGTQFVRTDVNSGGAAANARFIPTILVAAESPL